MGPEVIHVSVQAAPEAEAAFTLMDAVTSAGPIGLLTLLVLLGFSVASWAIIALKFMSLKRAEAQSAGFLDTFWASRKLDEIFEASKAMDASPVAQVFQAGYQELLKVKQRDQDAERGLLDGAANVERALRRAEVAEMTELERRVPFLATVGSTAPFIGLFGTVVGIINAFSDIATHKSASLTTVAPGIAEALVATAAGLLAAIPAVIAFNYFGNRIKVLGHEMETFGSDFMNIVRRHFF